MRSELVHSAGHQIENRFLLATTVMRAVRKLHINSTRTEDSTNNVLAEVANGRYCQIELPPVVPPPSLGMLLIAPAA